MTAARSSAGSARTNGRSVQQAIEEAIDGLLRRDGTVKGAGRTDAGVHALGQVAHVDLARDWPADTVRDALNAHLRAEPGRDPLGRGGRARFRRPLLRRKRHYLYRIIDRRAPPALDRGRVWWVGAPLDADAMHEAAQSLVGKHDFTTFRAAECQAKSPVKTLDRLDVTREGDEVVVRASARSFLHNQVRSMVGTLKQVGDGRGRWPRSPRRLPRATARALRPGRAAGRALSGVGRLLGAAGAENDADNGRETETHQHVQRREPIAASTCTPSARRAIR